MRTRIDGAWREVTGGRVYIGGAWKELASVRVYVGGAWKDAESFFPPFAALNIAPDPVDATGRVGVAKLTPAVTATPTGGTPPFTYAWTRVSGDTGFTINSPAAASTTFTRTPADEVTYSAVFQCAATDALGTTRTDTVSVSVTGVTIIVP